MIEKTNTTYEAEDGTQFDTQAECVRYEKAIYYGTIIEPCIERFANKLNHKEKRERNATDFETFKEFQANLIVHIVSEMSMRVARAD